MADFVSEGASTMDVDMSTVAMPLLAATASAIGNARRAGVKGTDWTEPCVLWTGVISSSATLKTSAQSFALRPLQRVFDLRFSKYRKELAGHHARKKERGNGDAPDPRPVFQQPIVSDATVEALAPILSNNPKGLLLARDELSAWLNSFNQYKGGKGTDQESWLSMYDAQSVTVNRKTNDQIIHVPHAAVSICGTIQPPTLRGIIVPGQFTNGLIPRFVFAMPPLHDHKWSCFRASPEKVQRMFDRTVDLLCLGARDPEVVEFSPETMAEWIPWHDDRFEEARNVDDPLCSAIAKSTGRCARIALMFQLVQDPESTQISKDSVSRAIALSDWLNYETSRLYTIWEDSGEDKHAKAVFSILARKGPEVSIRDILRSNRLLMESARAKGVRAVLDSLAAKGVGEWTNDSHTHFRLSPSGSPQESNPDAPDKGLVNDRLLSVRGF